MNQSSIIPINLWISQMNMPLPLSFDNQNYINGQYFYSPFNSLFCCSYIQNSIQVPPLCNNLCFKNMMMNNQQTGNQKMIPCNQMVTRKKKSRQFFTKEEDEIIKKFVQDFGTSNWFLISLFLNGRTPKQCRDRYINYLVPGIFQGEWTKEEDDLLIKLYNEYGSKWSMMKNYFPNRSTNSIKNRWSYFLNNKRKKDMNLDQNNDSKKNNKDFGKSSNINDNSSIIQDNNDDFEFQINNLSNNLFEFFSDYEWI